MARTKVSNKFYIGNCTHLPAESIEAMLENPFHKELCYETFVRHVGGLAELRELFPQYEGKLTLYNDPCVSFHRSKYDGAKCVYLVHSAIEYVFTESY